MACESCDETDCNVETHLVMQEGPCMAHLKPNITKSAILVFTARMRFILFILFFVRNITIASDSKFSLQSLKNSH